MSLAVGSDNLAFLDGYLFRVMVDLLKSEGVEPSGLYDYYRMRIEQDGNALSAYDRVLFDYALANFDQQSRRVVHAGIGIGTLTSALAMAGYTVAGIERENHRFRAASRVREALAEAWPDMADRYILMGGEFPSVLAETPWIAPETVLVFTNCGAGWSDELTADAIASFRACGDVVLDARLFGNVRDLPAERQILLERIEAQGLTVTAIAGMPPDAFYYHVRHGAPR